jgi:hypothetical protein
MDERYYKYYFENLERSSVRCDAYLFCAWRRCDSCFDLHRRVLVMIPVRKVEEEEEEEGSGDYAFVSYLPPWQFADHLAVPVPGGSGQIQAARSCESYYQ